MRTRSRVVLPVLALLAASCADTEDASPGPSSPDAASSPAPEPAPAPAASPRKEPDHVSVDHILVGVGGAGLPGITRTKDDARTIAYDILERVRKGEDWAALKSGHSDDRPGPGSPPGGPYAMANRGVAKSHALEFDRAGMVAAFGDVGFRLEVGDVGIADFDARTSPFGYHLIKRVR